MARLEEDAVIYVSSRGQSEKNVFQIHLSNPIMLSEALNFEIAAIKIQYPSSYNNVTHGHINYYSHIRKKRTFSRIPDGYYPDPESFIKAFQKVLGKDSEHYPLTYVPDSKIFLIQLQDDKSFMHLSQNLTKLCGLPSRIKGERFHKGETTWEPTGGNSTLHLLCSIASLVHVNQTKKPLILSTSFGAGQKAESQIQYEPQNPIYTPIHEKQIQSIEMTLQNEHGEPFPFLSGDVTVTLHIRPASPRL